MVVAPFVCGELKTIRIRLLKAGLLIYIVLVGGLTYTLSRRAEFFEFCACMVAKTLWEVANGLLKSIFLLELFDVLSAPGLEASAGLVVLLVEQVLFCLAHGREP